MHNPVFKPKSNPQSVCRWAIAIGIPMLASLLCFHPPASAQPIFENTTINSNFSGTRTLRGISGGSVPASQVAGRANTATGPCVGYLDNKPGHTIVLNSFFRNLTVQVQSPADTTMVVRGPGGTWCNDDYEGKNPGISGQWLEGTYNVWVGSYDRNNYNPYVIRIIEGK